MKVEQHHCKKGSGLMSNLSMDFKHGCVLRNVPSLIHILLTTSSFFKEYDKYPVWTCRDPISLNLGTRFSLILGILW